ncbi:MAG: hypothetical protein KA109_19660, partial [Saprospiraceae bacterium]|nr:hypothetical protein [Saprospiraceae bacterium]
MSLKVDAQISFSPNSAVQNSSTFGVTVTGTGTNFLPGTTTCVQIQTPTTLSLTNVMVSSNSSLSGDLFVPPGTPPGIYNGIVYRMGCDDFGSPGLLSWNCANCFTINPSECTILQAQLTYGGQFLPNPLPVGYADSAYSHDIAFKLKKDTTITMPAFGTLTIPFDSCKILSIGNLPPGLNLAACDDPQCTYYPPSDTVGCLTISGTPTNAFTYNDSIEIVLEKWITLPEGSIGSPQLGRLGPNVISFLDTVKLALEIIKKCTSSLTLDDHQICIDGNTNIHLNFDQDLVDSCRYWLYVVSRSESGPGYEFIITSKITSTDTTLDFLSLLFKYHIPIDKG